jgi:hypothetical protein
MFTNWTVAAVCRGGLPLMLRQAALQMIGMIQNVTNQLSQLKYSNY